MPRSSALLMSKRLEVEAQGTAYFLEGLLENGAPGMLAEVFGVDVNSIKEAGVGCIDSGEA
jgi:hypothetical protein